nr:hypothetical protein B0A51_06778 [Rachicladosporium sp. CCFEE 5018]
MSSPYSPEMTFEYVSPSQLAMSDISSLITMGSISTLNLLSPALSSDILTPRTSVSSETSLNTTSEIRSNNSLDDAVDLERDYDHPLTLVDSLELYRCRARSSVESVASCRYHKSCIVKSMSQALSAMFKGGFRKAKAAAAKKCLIRRDGSEGYGREQGSDSEREGSEGEGSQVSTRPVSPWLELEEMTWEERKENARW